MDSSCVSAAYAHQLQEGLAVQPEQQAGVRREGPGCQRLGLRHRPVDVPGKHLVHDLRWAPCLPTSASWSSKLQHLEASKILSSDTSSRRVTKRDVNSM